MNRYGRALSKEIEVKDVRLCFDGLIVGLIGKGIKAYLHIFLPDRSRINIVNDVAEIGSLGVVCLGKAKNGEIAACSVHLLFVSLYVV